MVINMSNLDISALEQTVERYPWFSLARLELFKKMCELGEEQKQVCLSRVAAYVYSREGLYEISKTAEAVPEVAEQAVVEVADPAVVKEVEQEQEVVAKVNEPVVAKEAEPAVVKKVDVPVAHKAPTSYSELDTSGSLDEISFEIENDPLQTNGSPKVILAGGDYFSRTDFDQLELDTTQPLDKFIVEKPSLLRSNLNSGNNEMEPYLETETVSVKEEEKFEDSGFYTETLAKIYTEQGFYKRALEVYAKLILLYPEKSTYFASLVQELKSKHN